MANYDVYLQTGVTVTVPDDTDPDSDAGVARIKAAARSLLIDQLVAGEFDIDCEPYNPED